MRLVSTSCVAIAVFVAVSIIGKELPWLYQVEIDVPDRSQTSSETALKEALHVCLMRISGSTAIAKVPQVQEALDSPSSFLVQYRFATRLDLQSGETDVLVAQFDEQLIRNFTQRAGLAIWPSDRPSILMWFSTGRKDQSSIVETNDVASHDFFRRARERGVELTLPFMDLADRRLVSPSSIDGEFWLDLRKASARYNTDLTAAISTEERKFGDARLSITVWFGGSRDSYLIQASDIADAPSMAVDFVVDYLAQRYAITRDVQSIFRIRVQSISTIKTYADLLEYLENLEFIDRFELVSYRSGILEIDLYTPSTQDQLNTLLLATEELITEGADVEHNSLSSVLEFVWQGTK